MKLKINFVDFWPDFIKDNNYFFHLLSTKYEVVIDEEDPDLLFFSVDFSRRKERDKYINHRCKKIFFAGENVRPNLDGPESVDSLGLSIGKSDFSFTFDFTDHPNHYRLPLWSMQIDWFNKGGYVNPQFILPENKIHDNEYIRKPKNKFCAFIFNNLIPLRVEPYNKVSKYKQVDGYGKPFGNWFYGERIKYDILSDYKFSLCLENSISPVGGYYTEKLFHAKTAGTVPLYWSDDKCSNDFNVNSFVNLNDFESMDHFVEKIIEIDNSSSLYQKYLNEPLFIDGKVKTEFRPESVMAFFESKVLNS